MSDLQTWKSGDEISGLPNYQVSGAVIVTRLLKTLRILASDAKTEQNKKGIADLGIELHATSLWNQAECNRSHGTRP